MRTSQIPQPKKRSAVRRYFGKAFFRTRRLGKWLRLYPTLAKTKQPDLLLHSIIQHRSFLLRPLKDVEMQYQHNKVTNLQLAIQNINSILIKPGEIFSLWYLIGYPGKFKGYKKGLVLRQGRIEYDYGGGLCQLGNLLYWMVLHTPLTIVERWRHSYDVFPDVNRTLPFGSGATLSYNYIDLMLRNDTEHTFQIQLYIDAEYLNGEILCSDQLPFHYTVYESQHLFRHETWGGYTRHNEIRRKKTSHSGEEIEDEVVTQNHSIMMYSPFLKNG